MESENILRAETERSESFCKWFCFRFENAVLFRDLQSKGGTLKECNWSCEAPGVGLEFVVGPIGWSVRGWGLCQ
jgi:hypothetical protein